MAEFWKIFGTIVIRTMVSVVALFILAKLVGVRQIAQLTFFDYICGITIGSLAAVAALDDEIPLWTTVLGMALFSLSSYLASLWTDKSILARRLLTGTPMVLIEDGQLIEKALASSRTDVNDLLREARCAGFFNLSDIAYAILETNGKFSFLPRADMKPVTPADLQLCPAPSTLVGNIIIDGKIMQQNLKLMGRNQDWLHQELARQSIRLKDVLLATLDEKGNLSAYLGGKTSNRSKIFD
nr:DUF421 domain-containing protein [bacterium]